MTTYTTGTKAYSIPLPEPYHFNTGFPLLIIQRENAWLVECPAFDEYGTGDGFDETVKDLGSSIAELYELSKKRKARGHKLGQPLEDLIKLFEESTK